MKEIKAYIRPEKIDDVVHALEAIGLRDMTIIDVAALGNLRDPEHFRYSIEFVEQYSKMAKLELVVDDDWCQPIVTTILRSAHTGLPGDGVVFVSPVLEAYRIREKKRIFKIPVNRRNH